MLARFLRQQRSVPKAKSLAAGQLRARRANQRTRADARLKDCAKAMSLSSASGQVHAMDESVETSFL